jgi:hypothetical protein
MKVDMLRALIREEVKTAIKEELKDILTEAVKIASSPEKETIQETMSVDVPVKRTPVDRAALAQQMGLTAPILNTGNPLESLLQETRRNMDPNEFNMEEDSMDYMGSNGLDISKLSFVKNANKIYRAAEAKKP